MKTKRRRELTTTQIIAFGFLGAIVVGTILLTLPMASANGVATPLDDALFTSAASVCVTGITVLPTWSHWSLFGEVVILLLIEVGGLGIITFTTIVLMVMKRKISMKERILIQDAYNLDSLRGVVRLTIRIVKGTLCIEAVGTILYAFVFIPDYGMGEGLWMSVFHAVSAFCNAGKDLLGDASLTSYRGNVIMNFTTMGLVILGGLGFPVWYNVTDILKKRKTIYSSYRDAAHHFNLHTKVVLSVSIILIVGGAALIYMLEFNNPQTLGCMNWWEKIMAALFQSVTLRTAGFYTVPQECFRNGTAFVCILLMFIGGSPSGTAGGVKTTTIGIIMLAVFSIVKGRKDTEAFGRKISTSLVKKAMAVMCLSLSVMFVSVIILSIVQPGDFLDILYETTAAIGTTGLSRGITGNLNFGGKIVIMCTMYIGRIGPISLALFFNSKKYINAKGYPVEGIGVG